MPQRNIVLTNDDGIEAPGLRAAATALEDLGHVWVVAPDRERSASSHALTLHKPLRVSEKKWGGKRVYAVNGTPSDCAFLAIKELLPGPAAFLVSGINAGANVGKDTTYSGTVSAAMESSILGVPAMAISITKYRVKSFRTGGRVCRKLVEWLLKHPLPEGVFLNVNVPPLPLSKIQGVRVSRQSQCAYKGRLEKRTDLRGVPYYWIGGERGKHRGEEGTDISSTEAGYVSVTPIHLDLTAAFVLTQLKEQQIEKLKL